MIFTAIVAGITSAVAAIGSAISAAVATIGPVVATFASKVVTIISKIPNIDKIEKILKVLINISDIFKSVLKILGIEQKDEPEKLGYKSEHCDKKRSDFESASEYIDYLNKYELTPKEQAEYENLKVEDKVKYAAIGTAVEGSAIGEKTGIYVSPEISAALYKINSVIELKNIPEKIVDIINTLKDSGINNSVDIVKYLQDGVSEKNEIVEKVFRNAGISDKLLGELKDSVKDLPQAINE